MLAKKMIFESHASLRSTRVDSANRRSFLGAIALGVGTSMVPRRLRAASANADVRVGVLGAGGKGSQLAEVVTKTKGAKLSMVADADIGRASTLAARLGAVAVQDLRKVLDSPEIDAVVIATCDHWHCLAAIWALEAGKDVYVEKPLSHSHWEGQQVVAAAKKFGRVVQLGTQQRSDPLQQQAREFLHAEKALGDIRYVQANRLGPRDPAGKRATPLPFPKEIDANLWFGPADIEPIYREKLHYDWHWDWSTGTGEMGNWGVHILDDVRNVAYKDSQSLPTQIVVGGGRIAWNDSADTPNVHFALLTTESFPTLIALSNLPVSPGSKQAWSADANRKVLAPQTGYIVACEGGYYLGQRGRGEAIDLDGKLIRKFGEASDMIADHMSNFIEAVRSQAPSTLNAPVENGHYSTAWCNLANVGFRAGTRFDKEQLTEQVELPEWEALIADMTSQVTGYGDSLESLASSATLSFDRATELFTGMHCEAANGYLRRQYRKGFEVKPIV
jgi:predicted dehydrogenase